MFKVAVIATTGKRKKQLKKSVSSLMRQVDALHIYDNSENPDLGALGKFAYVDVFNDPVYYFTCDDDIIYPQGYVSKTIEWIEETGSIVSWHGRKLDPKADKYYGYPHTEEVRFFQEIDRVIELDTGGTGVMGFRTDYFKPDIADLPYKRQADLTCGLEAAKQGKKIISPPKKHQWIVGQEVKSSIFKTESRGNQAVQIELMNKILECKIG